MQNPEGSGNRKGWKATIVIVVVVIVAIASIFTLLYLSFSSIFGQSNHYTTDANVTPVAGQTSLIVVAGGSSISLNRGTGDFIHVSLSATGRMDLSAQNVFITVEKYNSTVEITLHTPPYSLFLISDGNLYLPPSLNLTYVNLTAQNGNENVFGPVNVTGINASTSNGNIGVYGLTGGYVSASTLNGIVIIESTGLDGASASTTNGNIYLTVSGSIESGNYTMKSSNGNLELTIGPLSRATLNLSAINGKITTSNLSVAISSVTSHSLTGTLNGGGATVIMQTNNGDISVAGS